MDSIVIEGLSKQYGVVRALDDLSLTVEQGTVFGFLGPNGAGKTTTIRILTGLARPTVCRSLRIGGHDGRTERRQIARAIGYLPENPAFYPWLTPREFLDMVGRIFEQSSHERSARIVRLLAQVGLSEVQNRRVGGFSRGMRQRLGIAQALMNDPVVVFLDEPVSALDPVGRKDLLDLIVQMKRERTVFMSTHILADIERVCDTVGILKSGHMVAVAPQRELTERYAVPIFEIDADPSTLRQRDMILASWTSPERRAPWISAVTAEAMTLRIRVTDLAIAKQQLLPLILHTGIIITRFEVVQPTLEDVFLRLVEG